MVTLCLFLFTACMALVGLLLNERHEHRAIGKELDEVRARWVAAEQERDSAKEQARDLGRRLDETREYVRKERDKDANDYRQVQCELLEAKGRLLSMEAVLKATARERDTAQSRLCEEWAKVQVRDARAAEVRNELTAIYKRCQNSLAYLGIDPDAPEKLEEKA